MIGANGFIGCLTGPLVGGLGGPRMGSQIFTGATFGKVGSTPFRIAVIFSSKLSISSKILKSGTFGFGGSSCNPSESNLPVDVFPTYLRKL